ncbi:hypothetical protein BGY98DRAFT_996467 [Russula aff. rugulosa BPL654]|nr:hypothetical protein BGY98DRAFT_996467 [Russula aff. rugulosa BPL654]
MHQYKAVAQTLLIFSIFNLVLGAPVVREIYDARDGVVVPTTVGNMAVMSKEQHQSRSDGAISSPSSPPPDEPTTSHSSPLLTEGLPPLYTSSPSEGEPDSWTDFHNLPIPPSLHASSSPDIEGPSHELPTHPGEITSLPVSSPPGEIVPATDQPVHGPWPSTLERPVGPEDEAVIRRLRWMIDVRRVVQEGAIPFATKFFTGIIILGTAGGVVAHYRHRNHHNRTIDSDWYVSNPSHLSCRYINVPNHKRSNL